MLALLITLTACSQIRPEYPSESLKIPPSGKLLQLNYEGFTIWLDCEKRGAMKFQYNAQHDTGNEARTKGFKGCSLNLKQPQQKERQRDLFFAKTESIVEPLKLMPVNLKCQSHRVVSSAYRQDKIAVL